MVIIINASVVIVVSPKQLVIQQYLAFLVIPVPSIEHLIVKLVKHERDL